MSLYDSSSLACLMFQGVTAATPGEPECQPGGAERQAVQEMGEMVWFWPEMIMPNEVVAPPARVAL
jgi:hypothetical protein